ncbi:MAG: hypothetical protein N3A69_07135, partial [Leptospiraceae bacterium]|nr:hypothetical protein [Leptospiraceae bacterium]
DKIHALTHQVYLFCLVGIGSFMSTTFSFFYKKNSHISVTTSAYLYGFILSMISLLYLIGTAESFPIELEIILLAAIGGVYIPYIYVIIAEHSRAKGRSTMFAVAEIVQISASLIGSILNLLFLKNSVILFSITSLLFLLAFLLQIRGKSV